MTRPSFIHVPNGIYSVVSKCNNDEFHFDAMGKFRIYLSHLHECKRVFGFELYDIVCMSNHMHELYRVPRDISIARILHRVKGLFSLRYNRRFDRKDHFWRNKPFYRIVESESYAFHLMNYFHWNPVRAGMVDHPAQWPFSGYRFHILGERKGIMAKLLTPLPGIDPSEMVLDTSQSFRDEIQHILAQTSLRFVGSDQYIDHMQARYGR